MQSACVGGRGRTEERQGSVFGGRKRRSRFAEKPRNGQGIRGRRRTLAHNLSGRAFDGRACRAERRSRKGGESGRVCRADIRRRVSRENHVHAFGRRNQVCARNQKRLERQGSARIPVPDNPLHKPASRQLVLLDALRRGVLPRHQKVGSRGIHFVHGGRRKGNRTLRALPGEARDEFLCGGRAAKHALRRKLRPQIRQDPPLRPLQ